jgi:hypothetical protein
MSVSHSEPAEPAGASDLDEWEALRWRELPWVALPHPIKVSVVPYLTVQEVGRLDSAMTNREAAASVGVLQGHAVSRLQRLQV